MGQAMNKLDAGPPLYVRNDIRSQSNARDHDMDCNEVREYIYLVHCWWMVLPHTQIRALQGEETELLCECSVKRA